MAEKKAKAQKKEENNQPEIKERKSYQLSSEEIQKTQDWLGEKAPNPKCAFCGGTSFNLGDMTVSPLPIDQKGTVHIGGPVYPLISVTCSTCAHTNFFNSLIMEIGTKEGEKDE